MAVSNLDHVVVAIEPAEHLFKKEQPCPAYVSFRVTADGRALEVRSISETHNHERSAIHFQYLPHQRRLDSKDKQIVRDLLSLKANKKLVKQKLQLDTGRSLTLKDLSNMKQRIGKNCEDLDYCVTVLREKYNAEINILKDQENNFKGMFMQTCSMKKTMKAYPEFLGIDGTYKLLNIGIPVFLIVVEDGNCQTEIVCLCLLTTEDKNSFKWFLETFRDNNIESQRTKCIMTDKDLLERSVIRDVFSEVNLITLIFHSMRTFNREISCGKMGITSSSRLHSLQIMQKLVYAKTDEEFETFYDTLKQTAPKAVFEYFNNNWYNTRDEWSMSGKFMRGCFQNSTNNRIESINAKLKSVITKNSKLEEFLHSFFDILSTLEGERDYKAVYHLQKRLVLSYSPDSDERKYMDFLTHESAKLVIKQIVYSKRATLPTLTTSDSEVSIFSIKSSEGELQTSTFECNCNFNVSMLLPRSTIVFDSNYKQTMDSKLL
nr:unnamed protein product [Callosobruchus chinensis]